LQFLVESLMSLAAFVALMTILIAVPEPGKSVSKAKVAPERLPQAA